METRHKTWSLPLKMLLDLCYRFSYFLQNIQFSCEILTTSTRFFYLYSTPSSVLWFFPMVGFFFSHSFYPLFLKPSFVPVMELGSPWTMVIKLPETITIKQPLQKTTQSKRQEDGAWWRLLEKQPEVPREPGRKIAIPPARIYLDAIKCWW